MGLKKQDEKTLEVAKRTWKNYWFVYQHRAKEDVFEFTQLFNSMLGMVICVREGYYKSSPGANEPSVSWKDLQDEGLTVSSDLRSKADAFSTLLSNLRHGFAHNNYEFVIDSGEITGVKVWNDHEWAEEFSEQEMREVALLAANYLICRLDPAKELLRDIHI